MDFRASFVVRFSTKLRLWEDTSPKFTQNKAKLRKRKSQKNLPQNVSRAKKSSLKFLESEKIAKKVAKIQLFT